jgi:hypothetical protein
VFFGILVDSYWQFASDGCEMCMDVVRNCCGPCEAMAPIALSVGGFPLSGNLFAQVNIGWSPGGVVIASLGDRRHWYRAISLSRRTYGD